MLRSSVVRGLSSFFARQSSASPSTVLSATSTCRGRGATKSLFTLPHPTSSPLHVPLKFEGSYCRKDIRHRVMQSGLPQNHVPLHKIHFFSSSAFISTNDSDDDEQESELPPPVSSPQVYPIESYNASVVNSGNAVSVQFPVPTDGGTMAATEESVFDAAWLWSNCPSAVLPDSGQKTRSPGEFPKWKVESVSIVDAAAAGEFDNSATRPTLPVPPPPPGSCHPILGNILFRGVVNTNTSSKDQPLLRISWDNENSSGTYTSNVSYFDMEWLRQWRYDGSSLQRRRQRSEVTATNAIPTTKHDTGSGLVEVEYSDIVSGDESNAKDDGLFTLFEAIFNDGAALIRSAPSIVSGPSTPVAIVGMALGGSLSHGSLYGDVFHVKSIPSAHNIAYTSLPCRPHQDLAYYESPPGIQMMHCVGTSPTLVGGESILVDCMAAAEQLRRMNPDYFKTLVTCPATFVKQREGACMTYLRPHIVLKEGPDMNDMDREIVTVNWSPPFEGPLCVEPDQVRPYYKAYAAFEYMLDNSLPIPGKDSDHLLTREEIVQFASYAHEQTWECSLKPGEMLVFSNKRMLHGRRGFASKGNDEDAYSDHQSEHEANDTPIRHLVGAYTNIDDTLCRYRVLLQERMKSMERIPNVGNGTSAIP